MATFSHTHPIDTTFSIIFLIVCLFIAAGIADILESTFKCSEGIALVIGFIPGCSFLWFTQPFRNAASTWVYVRICLKTKISFKESGYLSPLFSVNGSGLWHPMTQVKKLAPEFRRGALFSAAAQILK